MIRYNKNLMLNNNEDYYSTREKQEKIFFNNKKNIYDDNINISKNSLIENNLPLLENPMINNNPLIYQGLADTTQDYYSEYLNNNNYYHCNLRSSDLINFENLNIKKKEDFYANDLSDFHENKLLLSNVLPCEKNYFYYYNSNINNNNSTWNDNHIKYNDYKNNNNQCNNPLLIKFLNYQNFKRRTSTTGEVSKQGDYFCFQFKNDIEKDRNNIFYENSNRETNKERRYSQGYENMNLLSKKRKNSLFEENCSENNFDRGIIISDKGKNFSDRNNIKNAFENDNYNNSYNKSNQLYSEFFNTNIDKNYLTNLNSNSYSSSDVNNNTENFEAKQINCIANNNHKFKYNYNLSSIKEQTKQTNNIPIDSEASDIIANECEFVKHKKTHMDEFNNNIIQNLNPIYNTNEANEPVNDHRYSKNTNKEKEKEINQLNNQNDDESISDFLHDLKFKRNKMRNIFYFGSSKLFRMKKTDLIKDLDDSYFYNNDSSSFKINDPSYVPVVNEDEYINKNLSEGNHFNIPANKNTNEAEFTANASNAYNIHDEIDNECIKERHYYINIQDASMNQTTNMNISSHKYADYLCDSNRIQRDITMDNNKYTSSSIFNKMKMPYTSNSQRNNMEIDDAEADNLLALNTGIKCDISNKNISKIKICLDKENDNFLMNNFLDKEHFCFYNQDSPIEPHIEDSYYFNKQNSYSNNFSCDIKNINNIKDNVSCSISNKQEGPKTLSQTNYFNTAVKIKNFNDYLTEN